MYTLHLAKEDFKFSGTHFTIFSATSAERMHGHNYYVSLDLSLKSIHPDLGLGVDFNEIKPVVRGVCKELDEYILIPENSRFLTIAMNDDQVRVEFAKKSYLLPKSDVRVLPLVNISGEELAKYIGNRISASLPQLCDWESLVVQIQESRGQSVSYKLTRT